MRKWAFLLLLPAAGFLLTGCAPVGEMTQDFVEGQVMEALRGFDEAYRASFFFEVDMTRWDFVYNLLAFPIVGASIVALFCVPAENFAGAIKWEAVSLATALIPKMPNYLTGIGREIMGFLDILKISEMFEGMNWITEVLTSLTQLNLAGIAGASSAIGLAFSIPYYHAATEIMVVIAWALCIIAAVVVNNTRPLAVALALTAGWLLFPFLWAILVFALTSIQRLDIPLFQAEQLDLGIVIPLGDSILNILFIFLTWVTLVACDIGLPVVAMLFGPTWDFSGKKLPPLDVRGIWKETSGQLGGLAGLAGNVVDRRAYGRAQQGSSDQSENAVEGQWRELPPRALPPPRIITPPPTDEPGSPSRKGPSPESGGGSGVLSESPGQRDTSESGGRMSTRREPSPEGPESVLSAAAGVLPERSGEGPEVSSGGKNLKSGLDAAAAISTLVGHPEVGLALKAGGEILSRHPGAAYLPEHTLPIPALPKVPRKSRSSPVGILREAT